MIQDQPHKVDSYRVSTTTSVQGWGCTMKACGYCSVWFSCLVAVLLLLHFRLSKSHSPPTCPRLARLHYSWLPGEWTLCSLLLVHKRFPRSSENIAGFLHGGCSSTMSAPWYHKSSSKQTRSHSQLMLPCGSNSGTMQQAASQSRCKSMPLESWSRTLCSHTTSSSAADVQPLDEDDRSCSWLWWLTLSFFSKASSKALQRDSNMNVTRRPQTGAFQPCPFCNTIAFCPYILHSWIYFDVIDVIPLHQFILQSLWAQNL